MKKVQITITEEKSIGKIELPKGVTLAIKNHTLNIYETVDVKYFNARQARRDIQKMLSNFSCKVELGCISFDTAFKVKVLREYINYTTWEFYTEETRNLEYIQYGQPFDDFRNEVCLNLYDELDE